MTIIPAIDLIDGKCVRLSKGDYATQKVYNENPVEVAKMFEDSGITHLHVVDLDGAKASGIQNQRTLERICSATTLTVDFGGGLKSTNDVRIAFDSGAAKITGGSIAAKNRKLFLQWLETYGPERIILGADCKARKISTNGWLSTEEDLEVIDFIRSYEAAGITQCISTDIAKDGMLAGPSLELYADIIDQCSVEIIASGGISSMDDLRQLKRLGCSGAIVGKALYEGKISLNELAELC